MSVWSSVSCSALVVLDAVDAAVAHLRCDGVVAQDQHRADRGPHPALGAVDLRDRVDEVRGRLDRALHQAARRARVGLRDRVDELAQTAHTALDHAVERVDRLAARDLAGRVASHPVSDDVEAQLVVHEERVFVHGALATEIRERVSGPPQRRRRRRRLRRGDGAYPRTRHLRRARRLGSGSPVVARGHRKDRSTQHYTPQGPAPGSRFFFAGRAALPSARAPHTDHSPPLTLLPVGCAAWHRFTAPEGRAEAGARRARRRSRRRAGTRGASRRA